jgi:hypothetical protein
MKIGVVLKYFDFRNDIRRLISELTKDNLVVLFVNKIDEDTVRRHQIPNVEIRIIDENVRSIKNKIAIKTFKYFSKIPKSRQNYYLLQRFIISSIENISTRNKKVKELDLILNLPKFVSYDTYLNWLKFSQKTKINDIDNFLFISEIANDNFLSRCIKEKKRISVYIYSWDHPFKQIRFSNKVKYLSWSEETKKDLVEYQNIKAESITVWGASQFCYIHEYLENSKSKTRSFEFDYIYFVCAIGIDELVSQEIYIIKKINLLMKINAPFLKLVVRPYPVNKNWHFYESLKEEGVILDDKFKKNDLSIDEKQLFEKFEKIENAKLLLHLGTTMGLEASFFMTPSLLIDFGHEIFSDKVLNVKNFIHQTQNDKYLVNACSKQHIYDEEQLIKWLLDLSSNKILSQNREISNNFSISSFGEITKSLLMNIK